MWTFLVGRAGAGVAAPARFRAARAGFGPAAARAAGSRTRARVTPAATGTAGGVLSDRYVGRFSLVRFELGIIEILGCIVGVLLSGKLDNARAVTVNLCVVHVPRLAQMILHVLPAACRRKPCYLDPELRPPGYVGEPATTVIPTVTPAVTPTTAARSSPAVVGGAVAGRGPVPAASAPLHTQPVPVEVVSVPPEDRVISIPFIVEEYESERGAATSCSVDVDIADFAVFVEDVL